jgi:cytosine/adenosine deaminase-related metal-dependent hydrolase
MQHGEKFRKCCENNAKIAGRYFDQKLGVLEEGAAADVIIVNYNPLTPMNENNINGHLVFGVTGHDVVTTVANGKVLMKDRRLTEIDEAKVMAAAELGKRINSR